MNSITWLDLQLFADGGAGTGAAGDGGDGAETGVSADDAGRQMLRELGVPEDRINKRAKAFAQRMSRAGTPVQAKPNAEQQAAAAEPETTAEESTQAKRLSWDEIMADPEYNGEMQKVVQNRLKNSRAAQDALDKLAPAIEALCGKLGMDPKKPDYEALSKAVTDDDSLYESVAVQLGVSNETAKRLTQSENENKRWREAEERRKQDAAAEAKSRMEAEHYLNLRRQGEDLKKIFPTFDLDTELKNKKFRMMTSPVVGVSVEEAYRGIHHKEISAAEAQVTAKMTAERMANSIRSNGARPQENGTSAVAPSTATFDPRSMTSEQRKDIRRRVKAGERVTFG